MTTRITLCLSLFLVAGCYGAPQVNGFESGDKRGSVNLARGKTHLVIVTDGEMGSYGVRAGLFRTPHFQGTLELRTIRLPYSARGRHLRIGKDKYDLTQGRLFAVSFASGTPVIRQIDIPPGEMVQTFVENSAELKEFFLDHGQPAKPNDG